MLCIHLWEAPWLCFSIVYFSIWNLTSHQRPGLSNQSPPHMLLQVAILGQWVFMQFFYTGMRGRYWWTKLNLAKPTGSQLMLRLLRLRIFIGFSHAKCWLPSGRAYPPELSYPWPPGRAFHTPGKKGKPVNQAFPGLKVVLSPSGSSLYKRLSGFVGIALRKELQVEVQLRAGRIKAPGYKARGRWERQIGKK